MNVLLSLCQQELTTQMMMMMMLPASLPACLCPPLFCLACLRHCPRLMAKRALLRGSWCHIAAHWVITVISGHVQDARQQQPLLLSHSPSLTLPLPLQLVHTLAPTSRGRSDCTVCRAVYTHSLALLYSHSYWLSYSLSYCYSYSRVSLIKQNKWKANCKKGTLIKLLIFARGSRSRSMCRVLLAFLVSLSPSLPLPARHLVWYFSRWNYYGLLPYAAWIWYI